MTGRVFDIQRFSLHDGPGIRTTVFFKGCNLCCFWCHNPESMSAKFEIQYYPAKCIGCRRCLARCPHSALSAGEAGIRFDRMQCTGCGECTVECYGGARVLAGREVTPDEVTETLLKDRAFYESSGGGVTFSGGEPMLQHAFLLELLRSCREQAINTAVETAGNVPWEWFEEIIGQVDLFLFDVKHVDEEKHRQSTGAGVATIQGNLEKLLAKGARVWVRIPVIPGFNADMESMDGIATRLAGLKGIEQVEFTPFHRLGAGKCESLGREYAAQDIRPPSTEELREFALLFAGHGVIVQQLAD